MPDKIVFKKLNKDEIAPYHKIRLECLKKYPENFATLYEEELNSASFKFDEIISQNHPTDFLMGAYKDKELIGICGFIQESLLKTKHVGKISQMYVTPEFSGQGVATGLLKSTIQLAFENPYLEQIILAVADKNKIAQRLYKKHGFQEYGRLKNYFKFNNEYQTQVFMLLTKDNN